MARSPTTTDAFTAIAEPRRRELLAVLATGRNPSGTGADGDDSGLAVNDLVETLGWSQPQVSKHLAVLRQVGLVSVRRKGRERMYSVNGNQLKTIHDWTKTFERFWTHQLDRIKQRAETKARELSTSTYPHPPHTKEP